MRPNLGCDGISRLFHERSEFSLNTTHPIPSLWIGIVLIGVSGIMYYPGDRDPNSCWFPSSEKKHHPGLNHSKSQCWSLETETEPRGQWNGPEKGLRPFPHVACIQHVTLHSLLLLTTSVTYKDVSLMRLSPVLTLESKFSVSWCLPAGKIVLGTQQVFIKINKWDS